MEFCFRGGGLGGGGEFGAMPHWDALMGIGDGLVLLLGERAAWF